MAHLRSWEDITGVKQKQNQDSSNEMEIRQRLEQGSQIEGSQHKAQERARNPKMEIGRLNR